MKICSGLAGLALLATAFTSFTASAQSPSSLSAQPIKIVVAFAPGGGTDLYARLISNELAKRGTSIVVENKPGGSGVIAASTVARAKPDGHTLLFSSLGLLVSNTVLVDKLPYDPQKELRGVTHIGSQPTIIVARSDAPFKDIRGLVAYAKEHPEKVNRGSPGAAIITNLAPVAFESKYGFKTTHVPFNGDTPGLTALLGGQIDIVGTGPSGPMPYIREGRMKLLGVMGDKRLSQFPEVETFKEQGYEFDGSIWYGLSAPAGTPNEIVKELNKIFNDVLNDPAFRTRAAEMGIEAKGGTPAEYDAYVRSEADRWVPQLRKIQQAVSVR
ncbi:Bug family tripartite tricarboxylate transporter substrate binding protein [Ottowia thiooxydans]|uniref:Bug family tripartite tricarboxylate transporter substrate binding protein n=1 Tax=Ottowia thiooxydans TaxID=219182 RepID=UPI00042A00A1|nr:tripartite tricarboxylate transporter substrate binding protein [Ottowia thiooxydans]